jgi:hypothetical protein
MKSLLSLEVLSFPSAPALLGELLSRAGFDAHKYRDAHPDLQAAISDDLDAVAHFMHSGFAEGRSYAASINMDGMIDLVGADVQDRTYLGYLASALALMGFVISGEQTDSMKVASACWNAAAIKAVPLLVIGDSHARLCARPAARANRWIIPIHLPLPAAAAGALDKFDGHGGYGRRAATALRVADEIGWCPEHPILMKFGQHDAEFVFTFDRVRRGALQHTLSEFEEFCTNSVSQYGAFLDKAVPARLRGSVVIASTFPPAVADPMWAGAMVNPHLAVLHAGMPVEELASRMHELEAPDIFERTRLHRAYNDRLRAMAERAGFRYLDMLEDLLSPFGIVAPQYLGLVDGDHHLGWAQVGAIVSPILWHMVDREPWLSLLA